MRIILLRLIFGGGLSKPHSSKQIRLQLHVTHRRLFPTAQAVDGLSAERKGHSDITFYKDMQNQPAWGSATTVELNSAGMSLIGKPASRILISPKPFNIHLIFILSPCGCYASCVSKPPIPLILILFFLSFEDMIVI